MTLKQFLDSKRDDVRSIGSDARQAARANSVAAYYTPTDNDENIIEEQPDGSVRLIKAKDDYAA